MKNRKWMAVVVAFAFFCLINVNTLPLHAAPAAARGKTAVAADNDLPGAFEKAGASAPPAKKSPLVPILIGVLAAGAIAAVLLLVVFKTSYDITGTWNLDMVRTQPTSETSTATATFFGNKDYGTFTLEEHYKGSKSTASGHYTVNDKNVSFSISVPSLYTVTFTGSFSDKNNMNGTWQTTRNESGTWKGTRASSSTSLPEKASGKAPIIFVNN